MAMNALPSKLGFWTQCEMYNFNKDASLARVGHTAHHIQTGEETNWLLLLGGATRPSCCKTSLLYNIKQNQVLSIEPPSNLPEPGLRRYEHSSVLKGNELLYFGGAIAEGPLNDVCHLTIDVQSFVSNPSSCLAYAAEQTGSVPSDMAPRTQHMAVSNSNDLVIFSGGDRGSTPVNDCRVHVYNLESRQWQVVDIRNSDSSPSARLGHLMMLAPQSPGSEPKKIMLYLHGGLAGSDFFDDFYRLQIEKIDADGENSRPTGEWINLRSDGVDQSAFWPTARAGHGGAVTQPSNSSNLRIFLFGGFNSSGPLGDLQYFDEGAKQWTFVAPPKDSVVPKPRLDFAFTTLRLKVPNPQFREPGSPDISDFAVCILDAEHPSSESLANEEEPEIWRNFLFIHGGMDATCEIFHDAFICCLDY